MKETETDCPVIVITGASQGLGAAIARGFAKRGPCRLALLARREAELQEVAEACQRESGVEAAAFICDVREEASVQTAAAAVVERFGKVDILINNAGYFHAESFLSFSVADFDDQLAVNLRSAFLVSRAFVSGMIARQRGDIVNVGSIAARQAHPGGTGYCAAKAGLDGLSRVMREELKPHGIRVTVVHPGPIATPSWAESGVPEEQLMPPEDVAAAIIDLVHLSSRTVVEEVILRPMRWPE